MQKWSLARFTTMDIVLMALLAVANGVMTTYLAFVNKFLTTLGGPIATSTIVGVYMVYGLLAMYIIRKPGSALLTYLIGASVQMLMGISYGAASAYIAALCYAVVVELVFALYRYKNWGYFSMSLASFLMVPLWFVFAANMFGYWKWDVSTLVIAFVIRCMSGIILCGMLTKWLGDAITKTGMLRTFAVGKKGAA
ncbi:ECF transporter S component [Paenibacillus sp. N1-5-1-14]|uniref:ECF transporter S component n=1 Tax=Paenibacillus radicibacter TaxID=2972488 RepID=UPI002159408E|nr:ECF transporter S component [Paenibacillus radicibacter]MCR8641109.1 ECF transporter S component [Paenibacillus radicibacter]